MVKKIYPEKLILEILAICEVDAWTTHIYYLNNFTLINLSILSNLAASILQFQSCLRCTPVTWRNISHIYAHLRGRLHMLRYFAQQTQQTPE
jgi:hypothetical protein